MYPDAVTACRRHNEANALVQIHPTIVELIGDAIDLHADGAGGFTRDGFETDADCGTFCSMGCAVGARCSSDGDCISGMCGLPCMSDAPYGCIGNDYDTCR